MSSFYRPLRSNSIFENLDSNYLVRLSSHTTAQMLSAKILGIFRFLEIHHYPHIVDKNILLDYLRQHPKWLTEQIKYKFRDVAQVNPITLMNHLKIQKGETHLKPNTTVNYLKNEGSVEDFVIALENKTIKYGCIQSLDFLKPEPYHQVLDGMREKFSAYLPSDVLENIDTRI